MDVADRAGCRAGPKDASPDYLTRLEQASISESLENLLTFPYVAAAVQSGALVLHGAYFDVATGEVFVREAEGYRSLVHAEPVKA
jgi:carbonic anhydrase